MLVIQFEGIWPFTDAEGGKGDRTTSTNDSYEFQMTFVMALLSGGMKMCDFLEADV
jgi:hypothetical protein